MTSPVIFREDAAARIIAATRIVERQFNGEGLVDTPGSPHADPGPPNVLVLITDPQPAGYGPDSTGGYWACSFLVFDGPADLTVAPPLIAPDDVAAVAFAVAGGNLTPGAKHRGFVVGYLDGTEKAVVAVSRNATGITVSEGTCIDITEAGDDREIAVNVPCVQAALTFDVNIDIPSCITVVLVPTYAATLLGGEQVWTGAVAHVYVKNRTVTMLGGTEITAEPADCATMPKCCLTVWYCVDEACVEQDAEDPPPTGYSGGPYATEEDCDATDCNPDVVGTSCCPSGGFKENMTLTVSGTGGGSFPLTWDGTASGTNAANFDTGLVSLTGAGAGTITIRGYCIAGSKVLQNNTGTPDYVVTFSGVYTVDTCIPFNVTTTGTLVGAGSYNGEVRTFTWTE